MSSNESLLREIEVIKEKEKEAAIKEINTKIQGIDNLSYIEKASINIALKVLRDFDFNEYNKKNKSLISGITGSNGSDKTDNSISEIQDYITSKLNSLSSELGVKNSELIQNDKNYDDYIVTPLYESLSTNVKNSVSRDEFNQFLYKLRDKL